MNNSNIFPNKYKKMIAIPLMQQNIWSFSPSEEIHSDKIIFENIKKKLKEQDKILSLSRAGIIMILENEDYTETKFLLVQGKSGIWSFPKGVSNCNETTMNCAIRELYEETGIDIQTEMLNEENKCKIGKNLYYILKVKDEIKNFDIKDKKEIEKVEWIKFKDLKDMNINRDLRNIITFPEKKYAYHYCIF
jgi:8-oxo-dGTP pyrophosphatase MutT (NUDIX family)